MDGLRDDVSQERSWAVVVNVGFLANAYWEVYIFSSSKEDYAYAMSKCIEKGIQGKLTEY